MNSTRLSRLELRLSSHQKMKRKEKIERRKIQSKILEGVRIKRRGL